jgi:hypothetical protein
MCVDGLSKSKTLLIEAFDLNPAPHLGLCRDMDATHQHEMGMIILTQDYKVSI